jgi:hypothetical protein
VLAHARARAASADIRKPHQDLCAAPHEDMPILGRFALEIKRAVTCALR